MTGGRCHGPNCTRDAVIEDGFCSEAQQAAWHAQFDEQAQRRELVQQALRDNPSLRESAAECFRVLDEPEIQRHLEEEFARAFADIQTGPAQLGTATTTDARQFTVEDIARIYDVPAGLLDRETVKLTRAQLDQLARSSPAEQAPYLTSGALGDLSALPIELVNDERESTPYLEQRKRLQRAFRDAARQAARLPVSTDAAKPQVAPPNPQVGFLGQAFHWLFGRTT